MFSPSKRRRLEVSICDENLKVLPSLEDVLQTSANCKSPKMYPTSDFQIPKPQKSYDEPTFDNDFLSAKDFLYQFFNELEGSNAQAVPYVEAMQELPHTSVDCITASTTSDSIPNIQGSYIFQKELGDFIYLTLKLYKKHYYVHIRKFNNEGKPMKNGTKMDINSWYEFQYKIFAFNLCYQSASFIANNMILVLNMNNTFMRIKHLKNYSFIDLIDYQLEKLKEVAYELNKELLHHMYTNHLPILIKRKCKLDNTSPEHELDTMSKLLLCIEENVLTILTRIYECSGCVFNQKSLSLHMCFTFNNREKFQQLGDMILMLVDLDYVATEFSNRVDCITKQFLYNINVETIRNVLFK